MEKTDFMQQADFNFGVGTQTQGRARFQVLDAETQKVCQEVDSKNLLLDVGLAKQANGAADYAQLFQTCVLGGGTTQPNFFDSGGITFTQAGTTVTVVGATGFFTAAMIGGVFKWNTSSTAGDEMYITAIGTGSPSLSCTVSQSATVSTAAAARVWQVQQTALQSAVAALGVFLESTTYQPVATATSISGNVITLTRAINFPVQASNYTVNEAGYKDAATGNGSCFGRFDLSGSPVTVSTSQFLVVTLTFTFAVSPSAPTACANVGTNINTAGTMMINCWDCASVNTNGNSQALQSNGPTLLFDQASGFVAILTSSAPTLPSTIPTPVLVNGQCNTNGGGVPTFAALGNLFMAAVGGQTVVNSSGVCTLGGACAGGKAVVIGRATHSFSMSTAGGTAFGVNFGGGGGGTPIFYLNFTTPQTIASGTLAGSITFQNIFGRQLSN